MDYLPALKSRLGIDFDAHNALLEECVGAAVESVEQFTGHLLSPCRVQISYGPGLIDAEIPYGPITTPPTLPTGAVLTDEPFAVLRYANSTAGLVLTYQAGYGGSPGLAVPAAFKTAVAILAAELTPFGGGSDVTWQSVLVKYRRSTWAD